MEWEERLNILSKHFITTKNQFVFIKTKPNVFFAEQITGIFNSENNQQLRVLAVDGLKFYFTALIFVGSNVILSMYVTSTENAIPVHIISLLRGLLIIIPIAFLFSTLWGITGVWFTFPATECIVSVIGIMIYFKNKKKSDFTDFKR